jgi:hypothetical protein
MQQPSAETNAADAAMNTFIRRAAGRAPAATGAKALPPRPHPAGGSADGGAGLGVPPLRDDDMNTRLRRAAGRSE